MRGILCGLAVWAGTAHAFTVDDFAQLIHDKKITSIEDAIPLLPETFRLNYELMSDSLSVQPSNPQNPRAILFGDDGRFILTFNGDPEAPNYNRFEMIQFRPETKDFEMRFMRFTGDGPGELSAKNPKECLDCHGQNPQPIWGSENEWQGSYALNDHLTESEQTAFQVYLGVRTSHWRYRSLLQGKSNFYPFTSADGGDSHASRPGNRLAHFFIRLMSVRTANLILKSDYFQAHRSMVLLGLLSISDSTTASCSDAAKLATLDQQLQTDFGVTFPQDKFVNVYKLLARLTDARDRRNFMLQRLLLGAYETWDINHFAKAGKIGSGGRFRSELSDMAGFVASQLMAQMPEMKSYLRSITAEEMFDRTNGTGYTACFVAPYDRAYDSNALYFDSTLAAKACN